MHRLLAPVAALLGLALAAPGGAHASPSTAAAAAAGCPDQGSPHAGAGRQLAAMRCLINATRRSAGRPVLRANASLGNAARLKAARIAACGDFSHTPCGAPFATVFRAAGFRGGSMGENLAHGSAGSGSPRAILEAWLRSPGHRANLLRPSFSLHGLAVRTVTLPGVGQTRLWVNTFGS
jgi:uncharacterized protein YkwD